MIIFTELQTGMVSIKFCLVVTHFAKSFLWNGHMDRGLVLFLIRKLPISFYNTFSPVNGFFLG